MKTRIISALVAIPIFVWIVLYSPTIVYLTFWTLTLAVAGYEFSKLIPFTTKKKFYIFNLVNILFLAFTTFHSFLPLNFQWILLLLSQITIPLTAILWLVFIPILLYNYSKKQSIAKLSYYLILSFWLILSLAMGWIITTSCPKLRLEVLMLLVCIWAADGGAYFVGKFYGKHKFSPTISPNKTWEGFGGGFIISLIFAVILYFTILKSSNLLNVLHYKFYDFLVYILAMAITILYAAFGDLFQSMLKRAAGVKDSGNIIPGHGGVFDRIDSWLSALIVFPFCFFTITTILVKILLKGLF